MTAETLDREILEELRKITRLLAWSATRSDTRAARIEALSSVGFRPKDIADCLGVNSNIVRATLSKVRKRGVGAKSQGVQPE